MNYEKILKCVGSSTGGYGQRNTSDVSWEWFKKDAMAATKAGETYRVTISTEVSKRWLRRQYILAIDCDSAFDKDRAVFFLENQCKYETAVIESSPDHYWIITNHVGSLSEVTKIMGQVPGADEYHTECSARTGILFRGTPKIDRPASFIPYFELETFGTGEVAEWYAAFKQYFQGDFFHQLRVERANFILDSQEKDEESADF
jgi:hypothetical protein